MRNEAEIGAVVRRFALQGDYDSAAPVGTGHIHDTYCVRTVAEGREEKYLLQRINTHVFPDVEALMRNVQRVTAHLAAHGQRDQDQRAPGQLAEDQSHGRVLQLVPTRANSTFHRDGAGQCWRMFRFLAGTHTLSTVRSPAQAFEIARAFGDFQRRLSTLAPSELTDTIPGFHDTRRRFAALEQAMRRNAAGRAAHVQPEIDFALARKSLASVLMSANLPLRIAHHDAKPDNVLLDDRSGEAVCVIDLDTVMPGLAVFDFGDLVRSSASGTAEDEQDLSRIHLRMEYFEALARGYLSAAGSFLADEEKQHLVAAGKVITFENGLRFLADYLNGDTYYKVHRPGQNLDRCRTQFKLVESIEQQEDALHACVASLP